MRLSVYRCFTISFNINIYKYKINIDFLCYASYLIPFQYCKWLTKGKYKWSAINSAGSGIANLACFCWLPSSYVGWSQVIHLPKAALTLYVTFRADFISSCTVSIAPGKRLELNDLHDIHHRAKGVQDWNTGVTSPKQDDWDTFVSSIYTEYG